MKDKEKLAAMAQKGVEAAEPKLAIRDPYIFEFLELRGQARIDFAGRVLARHYGFTEEELDFIVNYDIKYRHGRDAGEEEN